MYRLEPLVLSLVPGNSRVLVFAKATDLIFESSKGLGFRGDLAFVVKGSGFPFESMLT